MFGVPTISAFDPLHGFDPEDHAAPYHLSEVLRAMPAEHLENLLSDISRSESTGVVSDAMQDILRRAACHADAERISSRLRAKHVSGPRRAA